MKLHAVADLERVSLAVVGNGPAFRDRRYDLAGVLEVDADQPVVDLRAVFGARNFEDLRRVEADDVVELPRHDQRVLGRFGEGRAGCQCYEGGSDQTPGELVHRAASFLSILLLMASAHPAHGSGDLLERIDRTVKPCQGSCRVIYITNKTSLSVIIPAGSDGVYAAIRPSAVPPKS